MAADKFQSSCFCKYSYFILWHNQENVQFRFALDIFSLRWQFLRKHTCSCLYLLKQRMIDLDLTCDDDLGIIGLHVPIIHPSSLSLSLLLSFLCIKGICVVFQDDQLWETGKDEQSESTMLVYCLFRCYIYLETAEQLKGSDTLHNACMGVCVCLCVWCP